jgi:transcriptional regulator with XRE-family HTH domain
MAMLDEVDLYISERIRSLRMERGMSLTALSRLVGVSVQQLQKYESGHNRVSGGRLWSIVQALDTDIETMFPNPPRRGYPDRHKR